MPKYLEKITEELSCGSHWLVFLMNEYPHIDKITNLVQSNGHIFKAGVVGASALQIAADYLEKHVKEYGDKQPSKEENNYQYQALYEKTSKEGWTTFYQGNIYDFENSAQYEADEKDKTIYKLLTILKHKKVD
jgi:hypothetical protein